MGYLRELKDRALFKLEKPRHATVRRDQTQAHPDRIYVTQELTSTDQTNKDQSHPKDSSSPQDLWQCAFIQLDEKDQSILSKHYPASINRGESRSRVIDMVDWAIRTTEDNYTKYQERGGIKIRRSTGEDIDLRKLAGKIIDAALTFKDVINKGVACDPTGHAAKVLARCVYIEENFFRHQTRDTMIGSAMIRVYKEILQYTAEVLKAQSLGLGKGVIDNITAIISQRLVQHRFSIEKEEQKLYRCVMWDKQLQNEKSAERILAAIDDELSKSLDNLTLRFSLPIAEGAFYDSYKDQHESFCLEDTRVQLRDEIAQWAQSHEPIFWLNGMAGTGKSTVARTVAQTFRERQQLGGSFFFKKGEADRDNAKRFITTIVKQLMTHNRQLALAVLRAIENDPDISAKALHEQFKKLLLQPLQSLPLSSTTTLVIVIDAIDECENAEEIRTILEHLPQTQNSIGMRLKIFLTSRPDNSVLRWFQRYNAYQASILHEISDAVVAHDISLFLQNRFAKIRESRDIPRDWPGAEKIQTLVTMSVPLFISAATVCLFIENEKRDPMERLTILLEDQAKYVTKMDKTYLPILKRLLDGQDDDEKDQMMQEFQQIVGVIILLAVPLSVHALSDLLNIQERTIIAHLDWLQSVLSVPSDRDFPIRTLHLSFREFLLATKSGFHVDENNTHAKIANLCLSVMRQELKCNICSLQSYGTQRANVDGQSIKQCLRPHLQYSCRYWLYHLERSKGFISEQEILYFLEEHLLHWLEAMCLMENSSEVVGIIDKLQSLKQNNVDSKFSRFLYDAKRFILKNLHMVESAPLQLYCSGLIFLPTKSIVREKFKEQRPKKINILPQVDETWHAELQTLEGHSDWISNVAFSPDSQIVASGSGDETIKLWDHLTGRELQTLQGHSDWVRSVAFSSDCQIQILASSSDDKTIKLWDVKTGRMLKTLEGHLGTVYTVAFSSGCQSQILASGSYDKTIKLWDATRGQVLETLEGHSGPVLSVAFSLDSQSQLVASGSEDATIKLWDAKTGQELRTLKGHSSCVGSVAFSPGSQVLASGSYDKTIKLWNATTGQLLKTFEGHSGPVRSIAFSLDGRILASGSIDMTIKLWDTTVDQEPQTLEGHLSLINSVAFSPNSQILASGSVDMTIKLWDTTMGRQRKSLEGHCGSVNTVALSPDTRSVASCSNDKTIKLWNTTTGQLLNTLKDHLGPVRSVAFSPDSSTVASGSNDKSIKLWNVETGKALQTLEGHSDWVRRIAFSPDGLILVSDSLDKTIKLWDIKTGKVLQTLEGHSSWVHSVTFSSDSQLLGLGLNDKTIKLWDVKTGQALQTSDGNPDWARTVAGQIQYKPTSQVSVSNEWVGFGNDSPIWLPVEYRDPTCSAMQDRILVLGYADGRIFIVGCGTN
ncbi:hypothetical protein N7508_006459 [Penicillium antarcticum]|uniref:uncharacterized protein n=1 Tax=Penicillium antarcticum TaxID=416450 RepID=UPI00239E17DB|nr:uncharacterized protein N7508_006459 [Penicillium antarcticum]KAJ5301596.1 hypothetical protein N7508_006459 [Penicillium antarcticum]